MTEKNTITGQEAFTKLVDALNTEDIMENANLELLEFKLKTIEKQIKSVRKSIKAFRKLQDKQIDDKKVLKD